MVVLLFSDTISKNCPGNHLALGNVGITKPICMPMVVTATDLMFREFFELLWLDKFHIEMDLVWFWRKLW